MTDLKYVGDLGLPREVFTEYTEMMLSFRLILLKPNDGGRSVGGRIKDIILINLNRTRTKLRNNEMDEDDFESAVDLIEGIIGKYITDNNYFEGRDYNVRKIIHQMNRLNPNINIDLSLKGLVTKLNYDVDGLRLKMMDLLKYYDGEIDEWGPWFYSMTIGWFDWISNRCTYTTMADNYRYFIEHFCENIFGDLNIILHEIEQFDDIPTTLREQIHTNNYDDGVMQVIIESIAGIEIGQ